VSGYEEDEDQTRQYIPLRQGEVEVEVKLKVRILDSAMTRSNICKRTHHQEMSGYQHPKTPEAIVCIKPEGEQAERTARQYILSCWGGGSIAVVMEQWDA
jgi:hypothetical protein